MSVAAPQQLYVDGIGWWASGIAGWDALRAELRGEVIAAAAPSKPAPAILAPTERRRATDSVLLALEVADQACTAAGRDRRSLPSVFTCSYGDLAVTDYMCRTLASTPTQLSPTKFHNSVHNAPSGYWGIASGNTHASTALSGGPDSFGAGLLEAAMQLQEAEAVLLVGYDIPSPPTLGQVAASHGLFGVALVLTSTPGPLSRARITLRLESGGVPATAAYSSPILQQLYTGNPMARCLPLFTALAAGSAQTVTLAAGTELMLRMEISECPS